MKSLKVLGLAVVFLVGTAYPLLAQEKAMKMAYVDLGRLFDEYGKTKEYDKVLEVENTKFQEERNKKIEAIRELQGKLAMLKDEEKTKAEADMEKMKNDILEFDRQKRTDLTKNRDEKVREILGEIEKIVGDYSKKEGYTFVFNDRVLIYGKDTLNITEPILKLLNDSYKPKK